MKFTVFCCSATGNNQFYVQQAIKYLVNLDKSYIFEIINVNQLLNQLKNNKPLELAQYDGLIFATYTDCYLLPPQIQKLIDLLPAEYLQDKPTFTLNTHGGDQGGLALDFQDRLKLTKFYGNLSQKFANNYYKFTYPKTIDVVHTVEPSYLPILHQFLSQIHLNIINNSPPKPPLTLNQRTKLRFWRLFNFSTKTRQKYMINSPLVINQSKCIQCNICINNCPVSIIKSDNGTVHFDYEMDSKVDKKKPNNCICCFTCIQNCPKQAITSANGKLDDFIQYHFSEYQISDKKGYVSKVELQQDFDSLK